MTARQSHPYHLVDVSPWPFLMSMTIFAFAMTLVSWFTHYPVNTAYTVFPAMGLVIFLWWRDVVREAKGGFHTVTVQKGIMIGFLLFL